MIQKTVTIVNKLGLHARPSAQLVTIASHFKAEIFYTKGELRVNGKSIMGVMMLAAEKGAELVIEVEGPDGQALLDEICKIIADGFSEVV
jgi:phosphocarrier protein